MSMNTKTCNTCGLSPPHVNFQKTSRKCNRCVYQREREARLKWAKAQPPNLRRKTVSERLEYKYGVTLEYKNALIESQGSACAICRSPLELDRPTQVNLDHCHTTGKIRGVLCRKCNVMIGLAGDKVEVLNRAIEYLQKE